MKLAVDACTDRQEGTPGGVLPYRRASVHSRSSSMMAISSRFDDHNEGCEQCRIAEVSSGNSEMKIGLTHPFRANQLMTKQVLL